MLTIRRPYKVVSDGFLNEGFAVRPSMLIRVYVWEGLWQ